MGHTRKVSVLLKEGRQELPNLNTIVAKRISTVSSKLRCITHPTYVSIKCDFLNSNVNDVLYRYIQREIAKRHEKLHQIFKVMTSTDLELQLSWKPYVCHCDFWYDSHTQKYWDSLQSIVM